MTRYLLDTHGALWWWTNIRLLGDEARAAIEDTESDLLVSAASA